MILILFLQILKLFKFQDKFLKKIVLIGISESEVTSLGGLTHDHIAVTFETIYNSNLTSEFSKQ